MKIKAVDKTCLINIKHVSTCFILIKHVCSTNLHLGFKSLINDWMMNMQNVRNAKSTIRWFCVCSLVSPWWSSFIVSIVSPPPLPLLTGYIWWMVPWGSSIKDVRSIGGVLTILRLEDNPPPSYKDGRIVARVKVWNAKYFKQ